MHAIKPKATDTNPVSVDRSWTDDEKGRKPQATTGKLESTFAFIGIYQLKVFMGFQPISCGRFRCLEVHRH